MRDRLRADLTRAMKARDAVAVAALRSALAAIDDAEAVDVAPGGVPVAAHPTVAGSVAGLGAAEVPRRVLTDADVEGLVRAEMTDRVDAAEHHRRLGRDADADRLLSEAEVLSGYLPPS